MKLNSIKNNNSFSGNLILQKPEKWTEGMLNAINNNKNIQEILDNPNTNVIGKISTTIARRSKPGHIRRPGDTLYKVAFVEKPVAVTFLDGIKNLFGIGAKKYTINKHYRSISTTLRRLWDFKK